MSDDERGAPAQVLADACLGLSTAQQGALRPMGPGGDELSYRETRTSLGLPAALIAEGDAADSAKGSTFERKKAEISGYFKERGITDLAEIPKAIFLYEVTSAGIMFAMWGICFVAQVSETSLVLCSPKVLMMADSR